MLLQHMLYAISDPDSVMPILVSKFVGKYTVCQRTKILQNSCVKQSTQCDNTTYKLGLCMYKTFLYNFHNEPSLISN